MNIYFLFANVNVTSLLQDTTKKKKKEAQSFCLLVLSAGQLVTAAGFINTYFSLNTTPVDYTVVSYGCDVGGNRVPLLFTSPDNSVRTRLE